MFNEADGVQHKYREKFRDLDNNRLVTSLYISVHTYVHECTGFM